MTFRMILLRIVPGLALCALLAGGCGGGGGSSKSPSSTPQAGETLRIYGFGKGDDVANSRAAVATGAGLEGATGAAGVGAPPPALAISLR